MEKLILVGIILLMIPVAIAQDISQELKDLPLCGNDKCDLQENVGNCPKDCPAFLVSYLEGDNGSQLITYLFIFVIAFILFRKPRRR